MFVTVMDSFCVAIVAWCGDWGWRVIKHNDIQYFNVELK